MKMSYNYKGYKIVLYTDGFTKSGNTRPRYKIQNENGEVIEEKIMTLKEAKRIIDNFISQ